MNDFLSLSAVNNDVSPVTAQLVSVSLPQDELKSYKADYVPWKHAHFVPIADELAQLSARFSAYMSFLRYTLHSARYLGTKSRDELRDIMNGEASRILSNALVVSNVKDAASNYLESMQIGSPFIINRVSGGYDLNFIGDNITTPKTCYVAYKEHGLINVSSTKLSEYYSYKTDKLESYSTELSLGAIRAGREILSAIFDSSVLDATTAGQRKLATVKMNFDFESLNDIFFKHTGVAISVEFMKNVSQNAIRTFGDTSRITVVRSPDLEFARIASRSSPGYDLSEHISEEGLALSQTISFAQTLHIPEKVAQFICQADEGKKVSYLYLTTWANLWTKRYMKPASFRTKGGKLKHKDMPLFIVPLSKIKRTTDIRRASNYAVEAGKGDDNNIYIAPNGGLSYCLPTALRGDVEQNLDDYESTMDAFFEHCYTNGLPTNLKQMDQVDATITGHDKDFVENLSERRSKVESFSGKILTYDWDYGVTITAGVENPTNTITSREFGSARVDTLTIADYLGFNFADPGESAIKKTFADSYVLMMNLPVANDETTSSVVGHNDFISDNKPTGQLIAFYYSCLAAGLVPDPQTLVTSAAQALNLTSLSSAPYKQQYIHGNQLSDDFKVSISNQRMLIQTLLKSTLDFCGGSFKLRDMVAEELGTTDSDVIMEEVQNHPVYFKPSSSRMRDFGNTYNLLGGKVFQLMCQAITEIPTAKLFVGPHADKFNYNMMTTRLLPQAVMFAHYIPKADEIFEKAEADAEMNRPDPNIDVSDIKVPGSVEGAQFFPHQVRTHGSLRKRPAFAIMDIRPGGGKTMLGLSDIAALIKELDELGESIKPVIICPKNLIVNWVDDMKTMTGTQWNLIPITLEVVKRWGYERLEKTITDAPKNTICAVDFDFLNGNAEEIVLGTTKIKVSNNLEFLKRLRFDYIVIDESQKCAGKESARHRNVKTLTTASHVKFLRLASGTFIHGRVSDAIGQVALYNGHIFRDGDVLTGRESDMIVGMNGDDIPIWKVDTPARARKKLSRYASIITLQKKHWAFLLPSPIEAFFAVSMVPEGDNVSEEDRRLGELHRQLYDTVLNESIDQLEQLAKNAKAHRADSEDDDEEESESEESDDVEDSDGMDFDLDEGELQGLNAQDLKPFIQRLERLLTNPMADPLAPTIFGLAGVEQYNSQLTRFVSRRIDHHFNPEVWSRDKIYKEYTLVSHAGKLWLSKKLSPGISHEALPDSSKGQDPQNSEFWREEPKGKVIVFCRYINSVQGVYDALPEKYKAIAVKYSGKEGKDNKLANLDAFKKDDRVQILIANEMGISEGHNLQLASRIIRVESPWNPGDLDQSASRIFRPDPAASKAMRETGRKGELYREAVFLDWVLQDGTLHVQKQARLIAKVFNKTRFDEVGNPNYEPVLNAFDLPEIPMSLDMLRSRSTLQDYIVYKDAYAALNGAQLKEFHDMRKTQNPSMEDLPTTPMLPGMRKIATPFMPNQKPDDPEGLGLESLRNVLRDPAIADNLDNIKGLPVVTDLGKGRIARYRVRYKLEVKLNDAGEPQTDSKGKVIKDYALDKDGNKIISPTNPLSSIVVKMPDGEMVTISDPGIIFVVTKLPKAKEKEFAVRNLDLTEAQERKAAEQESRAAERDEKRSVEDQKRLRREQRAAADRAAAAEDGRKRKENIKRGKPINAGIKRVSEVPSMPSGVRRVKEVPPIGSDEDNEVTLHPAYYHGYLTLEVKSDDPDAAKLKKLKFREVPSYAYVRCTRYNQFALILDYLEDPKKFVMSNQSVKRLEEVQAAFEEDKKAIYKLELAPQGSLPLFFVTSQKKVTTRKEIKPYPIVMPNELQIAVDIAACPIIKSHIGISIPGANTKWVQHPGHYMYFAKDKNDMKAKIKEVEALGIVVTNKAEALSEITNIKFRAPRGAKK